MISPKRSTFLTRTRSEVTGDDTSQYLILSFTPLKLVVADNDCPHPKKVELSLYHVLSRSPVENRASINTPLGINASFANLDPASSGAILSKILFFNST